MSKNYVGTFAVGHSVKKTQYKLMTAKQVRKHIDSGDVVNEVIPDNTKECSFYVDIDGIFEDKSIESFTHIIGQYKMAMLKLCKHMKEKYNLAVDESDIKYARYSYQTAVENNKVSMHVVIPSLKVNIYTIRTILYDFLYEPTTSSTEYRIDDFPYSCIDLNPYHKTNQQFRLPLCKKWKQKKRDDGETYWVEENKILEIQNGAFEDFILCNNAKNHKFAGMNAPEDDGYGDYEVDDGDNDIIHQWTIDNHVPCPRIYHASGKTCIAYDHTKGFICPVHEREHANHNLVVNKGKDGSMWINCFSPNGKGILIHKPSKTQNSQMDEEEEEKINDIQHLTVGSVTLPFRKKYLHGTYEEIKPLFEQGYCIIGKHTVDRQTFERYGPADIKVVCKPLNLRIKQEEDGKCTYKKVNFHDRWLEDPTRLSFKRMDFIPPPAYCPDDVLNTWRSFWWSDYVPKKTEEECNLVVSRFDQLLDIMCGGEGDRQAEFKLYVKQWLKHLLVKPSEKTCVCPIFQGPQGTGKDLLANITGHLLSVSPHETTYYHNEGNADRVLDKFNAMLIRKLLVVLNEFPMHAGIKYQNSLKEKITCPTDTLEMKGKDGIELRSNANYMILTNDISVVKIEQTDRRFVPIRTGKPRDTDFYGPLWNRTIDDLYWISQYILKTDLPESFNFKKEMPESDFKQFEKENQLPPYIPFMCSLYNHREIRIKLSMKDLYAKYVKWSQEKGFKSEMNDVYLARAINADEDLKQAIEKKHTKYGNVYLIDMEKLLAYKKLKYPSMCLIESDDEDEEDGYYEEDELDK
jgi:hypothetical protein